MLMSARTTTNETPVEYKVSKVTWIDARVSVDGLPADLPMMTSYGVIIYKDKKKTCICSLFGENNEPRIVTAIPTSLILKIKKA